ncbi:MAG: recombinase family protein, partial [Alistipes sp.]|nr:recombinase family protein [Alistipes sp.]
MAKKRCYIYTRVSTRIQVDGYSLDAQYASCKRYADAYDLQIVRHFSDEGKSGKNIAGRPKFTEMLDSIAKKKDDVDFVIVFKLSRFARNAADSISSVQLLQDYGVNLICVEDGIDTSKDAGKLLLSVLSAVYELERENIRVQTMAGREQKAKEGKWNGGFAPYGYKLVDGYLYIQEENDEAEVIREIFNKYAYTTWGGEKIATYLNDNYKKIPRKNDKLEYFTSDFVIERLDNPVYVGNIAYGRRRTEKVEGTRNEFKVKKQEEFPVYTGVHKAIVSEDLWNIVREKRSTTAKVNLKTHSLEHEHILSGIIKCPICGKGMYANVNRKKNKKTGEYYKDHFYYYCKSKKSTNGVACPYNKQWHQGVVNGAVEEVIHKMAYDDLFAEAIKQQINLQVDTSELDKELADLEKRLRRLIVAKDRVGFQIDGLDIDDPQYERRYYDLQARLDNLYGDIDTTEEEIHTVKNRIKNLEESKITTDNIYSFLLNFDSLYGLLTDLEKKQFMKVFVEEVQIFPEVQPNGKFLRSIKFSFPIPYEGSQIQELRWDNSSTVETVCLLSKLNAKQHIEISLDMDELDLTDAEKKATYQEIKDYVLEHSGLKVSSLYIAQVKQKCGIIERENYNKPKSEDAK